MNKIEQRLITIRLTSFQFIQNAAVGCRVTVLDSMTTSLISATPVALASGSEVGGLQGSHLGLPFAVQHGSGLSAL